MSDAKTEDDYHIMRQNWWNKSSNYKESDLYKHQLLKHCPGNCLPIFDKRVNKWVINPEFGLSAYIIKNGNDIEHIVKNHYMESDHDESAEWHIFKSHHYLLDSDTGKENIENGDYIFAFQKGEWVTSLKDILK